MARAIALDPTGAYRVGMAEQLDFEDQSFDLVVSYLSLIDIPHLGVALAEMARVLRPGGSLLIANLTGLHDCRHGLRREAAAWRRQACRLPR